jgi:SAM-dependent methyltransferase
MLPSSYEYWENRYACGGSSGSGSYGKLAQYKADFVNGVVLEHGVNSVIEFGCGDGNQLSLAKYPQYVGLDVSRAAIMQCAERFKDDEAKSFFLYDSRCFCDHASIVRGDLALSLDVIYHVIEDDIYRAYMSHLFGAARRLVVVYSSNMDDPSLPHIRHRCFLATVERLFTGWRLITQMPNRFPKESSSEFFVFGRDAIH